MRLNRVSKCYRGMCKKYEREYNSWRMMLRRCYEKGYKSYDGYGGRGIEVCTRWQKSFFNFFEDMGKRPSKNHTLDRINNEGNYSKGNCRWATVSEQSRNKRNNRWAKAFGKSKVLIDWSKDRRCRVSYNCILRRINDGWTIKDALTTPKVNHPAL